MLRYSEEGLAARPALFAPYNDIIVIVEDRGKENFYTELIRRVLPSSDIRLQVLGVGGKELVFQRLAKYEENTIPWREFYLVDGDFDELLGKELPNSVYIYRLRRYDIESYLVEDIAICTIAEEESPRKTSSEYSDSLNIPKWLLDTVDAATRLAACVALLQELDDPQARISQTIEQYVGGNSALPDVDIVESHIASARQNQSLLTEQEFNGMLDRMTMRMGRSSTERMRWISGKDIFIPLLVRLLRRHVGRGLKKESLCFRLARHCEFAELAELRDRISAAVYKRNEG